MRIEPALTYKGALAILGKYDSPTLNSLDKILGGFILGSFTTPAVAAAWGWLEQKNEAISLARKVLNAALGTLLHTNGYTRRSLIAAAHTAIVAESYFQIIRRHIGNDVYKEIALSKREKLNLLTSKSDTSSLQLIELLYNNEIPMPSAACGFIENLDLLREYLSGLCRAVADFMEKTSDSAMVMRAADSLRLQRGNLVSRALQSYESKYTRLMVDVPEFQIWMLLNEYSATRRVMKQHQSTLESILLEDSQALNRLERLLASMSGRGLTVTPPRETLRLMNRYVLSDPIIPETSIQAVPGLVLPSVSDIYVVPRFRRAVQGHASAPSEDVWWTREVEMEWDFEKLLAAQIASVDAVRMPMLVLGHPGAGKSLLSKMLAASMPAESYAVVRVPLRRVDADAPVFTQVEQALALATNGRIDWAALSEGTDDVVRVVILDGYDELLQASPSGRFSYLQEVQEFQRVEAGQGRPIVAIVTSRTIVADRMRIPLGCLMVKLEDFQPQDIVDWVGTWNRVNSSSILGRQIREFPEDIALDMQELTKQPLLLLMLALYIADPMAADLSQESSLATLYKKLIEGFVRREVDKFHDAEVEDVRVWEAQNRLDDLTVAAFAMFNRGRQFATEDELGADLSALIERHRVAGRTPSGAIRAARSIVGKFFFVHIAEANAHLTAEVSRSYEFLHATFAEYLIAAETVTMIERMSRGFDDSSFSRASASYGERIDDDRMFAILSHQVLATRQSTIEFVVDLWQARNDNSNLGTARLLEFLLNTAFTADRTNRFADYQPSAADDLSATANYTANIVLLRIYLCGEDQSLELARLGLSQVKGLQYWRRIVRVWQAGLDETAFTAIVQAIDLTADQCRVVRRKGRPFNTDSIEASVAQLLADQILEESALVHAAVKGKTTVFINDPSYLSAEQVEAALLLGALYGVQRMPEAARGIVGRYFNDSEVNQVLSEPMTRASRKIVGLFLLVSASGLPGDLVDKMLAYIEAIDGYEAGERGLLARAFTSLSPFIRKPNYGSGTLASDEALAALREKLSSGIKDSSPVKSIERIIKGKENFDQQDSSVFHPDADLSAAKRRNTDRDPGDIDDEFYENDNYEDDNYYDKEQEEERERYGNDDWSESDDDDNESDHALDDDDTGR